MNRLVAKRRKAAQRSLVMYSKLSIVSGMVKTVAKLNAPAKTPTFARETAI